MSENPKRRSSGCFGGYLNIINAYRRDEAPYWVEDTYNHGLIYVTKKKAAKLLKIMCDLCSLYDKRGQLEFIRMKYESALLTPSSVETDLNRWDRRFYAGSQDRDEILTPGQLQMREVSNNIEICLEKFYANFLLQGRELVERCNIYHRNATGDLQTDLRTKSILEKGHVWHSLHYNFFYLYKILLGIEGIFHFIEALIFLKKSHFPGSVREHTSQQDFPYAKHMGKISKLYHECRYEIDGRESEFYRNLGKYCKGGEFLQKSIESIGLFATFPEFGVRDMAEEVVEVGGGEEEEEIGEMGERGQVEELEGGGET